MTRDRTPALIGLLLVVLLGGGFFLPQWAIFIVTIAFANGLVALGLMMLLRAGLVSFGQALYYCLGAYAAGGLGRLLGVSLRKSPAISCPVSSRNSRLAASSGSSPGSGSPLGIDQASFFAQNGPPGCTRKSSMPPSLRR